METSYVIAAAIGAALGIAELLARYRDDPARIAQRRAAWAYVGINAGAAMVSLFLIRSFGWTFGQTGDAVGTVQVLVAGLGSAALFRSSLFIFKVGDQDVGLGPAVILTSLLAAADRSVDRDQATQRLAMAGRVMKDVDFDKAKEALVVTALAASANVTAEEAAALRQAVKALESENSITGPGRSLTLGVLVIQSVGAPVLEAAVQELGDQIK